MAKTLCTVLKRSNAKGLGGDPAALQLDLILSTGKALEYDPQRLRVAKSDIDKLTAATCPIERELMLSSLKMKTLGQAIR